MQNNFKVIDIDSTSEIKKLAINNIEIVSLETEKMLLSESSIIFSLGKITESAIIDGFMVTNVKYEKGSVQ